MAAETPAHAPRLTRNAAGYRIADLRVFPDLALWAFRAGAGWGATLGQARGRRWRRQQRRRRSRSGQQPSRHAAYRMHRSFPSLCMADSAAAGQALAGRRPPQLCRPGKRAAVAAARTLIASSTIAGYAAPRGAAPCKFGGACSRHRRQRRPARPCLRPNRSARLLWGDERDGKPAEREEGVLGRVLFNKPPGCSYSEP